MLNWFLYSTGKKDKEIHTLNLSNGPIGFYYKNFEKIKIQIED